MRLLDLFCGRGGWTDAFLARGWGVVGVDIVRHPDYKGDFIQRDVSELDAEFVRSFDFACASSPCEQFSLFGMKHFHPNPPHPELGIQLFNHSQAILEASGVPYVMENVRAAQQFVGRAVHHCGPFFLWGTGVPPLMPQGISKGTTRQMGWENGKRIVEGPRRYSHGSPGRAAEVAKRATIPPGLAGCVADYADRIVAKVEVAV